jgi:hypothetical protein
MRQQNVQQQNQSSKETIRRTAVHWRQHPLPKALLDYAASQGVDCGRSIFLKLEIDFPGMPRLFGELLTPEETFISFEIDTDKDHVLVELVDEWRDVTSEQNLSFNNAGIGIGYGALAVQVLREINAGA